MNRPPATSTRPYWILIALLLPGLTSTGKACLWFHGTDLHGFRVEVEGTQPLFYLNDLLPKQTLKDWRESRQRFESRSPAAPDFKVRSDRAAFLIFTGEIAPAIEILEAIEKEHPGEYITAANLGTAYELSGDDEKARTWIRRCVELNPDSHHGTEWLHVLILDAKLAQRTDPRWLASHSVLGLNFGDGDLPVDPSGPALGSLRDVQEALEYQLHERLYFVKPPDPLVADLLFDLGNVLALTMTLEHAAAVYGKTLEYGPARAELVQRRLAAASAKSGAMLSRTQWVLLIGALALGAVLFYLRRRRRRSSGSSSSPS